MKPYRPPAPILGSRKKIDLSRIARDLPPSGIRKFFDIAAQMQDVISLSCRRAGLRHALGHPRGRHLLPGARADDLHQSNYGLLELRQHISRHLDELYGVRYRPGDEILVTVGVSEGMDLAMRAMLDPGDEVLVPGTVLRLLQALRRASRAAFLSASRPVRRRRSSASPSPNWKPRPRRAPKPSCSAIRPTRPARPCRAKRCRRLWTYARRRNLYLISDEIYDRLTYDGPHVCVASLPGAWERTIMLNGFSKAYAMTGWRIGYACAPALILTAMCKIHAYTMLCAPIMGQKAALEALKSGEPRRAGHGRSVQPAPAPDRGRPERDRPGLPPAARRVLRLPQHPPHGPDLGASSPSGLLFEEHVAVVPGTAFGAGGEGHIRCSYATSLEKIEEALKRIARFVQKAKASSPQSGGAGKDACLLRFPHYWGLGGNFHEKDTLSCSTVTFQALTSPFRVSFRERPMPDLRPTSPIRRSPCWTWPWSTASTL